jgi:molybdopterin-guanine dinucleotide biosynthesis protein A
MTKRYARIASAQVQDAVSGLDSMLGAASEAETGDGVFLVAIDTPRLPEASTLNH